MAFFEGGASQFAGGGFMPSQATGADSGFGGTPMQAKKSKSDQTLRAVTIKQLVKDTAHTEDDLFLVDGAEVTNVTIVGKILDVQNTPTYISLTIEDGTGKADVRYWINDEGSEWFNLRRAEWQPGVYVRVYGHLRSFDKKKSLVGYNIKVVKDFNEVTFHFLQCIFQHKYFLGKGASPSVQQDNGAKLGGMPGNFTSGTPINMNGASLSSMPTGGPSMSAGPSIVQDANGGGMNAVTQDVLAVYNAPEYREDHNGLHINRVAEILRAQHTFQQVKMAVDFLSNEGHIYEAGDGCYRTCSN